MDTKYWGPSGWRLLHLIAEKEASMENVVEIYWETLHRPFWAVLPYILPCKFCRASLTTYYEKHPIPHDNREMGRWLYKIHNCVNAKLRSQGQTVQPAPPYSVVKKHYRSMLDQGCTELTFPGWEFLFCIADNYPGSAAPSTPMPDAPAVVDGLDQATKNKYNLLTAKERIDYLGRFWAVLGGVMPFREWRDAFGEYCGGVRECMRDFRGRRAALARLWQIKCDLEKSLGKRAADSYYDLCRVVASKRSGCSSSARARTCRAAPASASAQVSASARLTRSQKTLKKKHDKK
jgi:hypothetical protein